ncbi:zinc finger protein 431-like [Topomyia yanbarensis]|uniref:zinc finger protein 431-like n=1 Tax=Topomyia yanbarensis TaxID=2498891 RepID=UPI00273B0FEB|nr:zinc finger protein 431-like [Topomyia yanbarensis]
MDNVENICRICLTGGTTGVDCLLISIFRLDESPDHDFSIVTAMQVICDLEVSEDDNFPKQICMVCYSRLVDAYGLRDLSQKSMETLSAIMNKATMNEMCNAEQDEENIYDVEYLEEEQETIAPELVDLKFERQDDLEISVEQRAVENVAMASDEIIYSCCGCSKSYGTEIELRKHSIQVHRSKTKVEASVNKNHCNICFKLFRSVYKLKAHRNGKNSLQPLKKCEFCGCNFYSSSGLSNHCKLFHTEQLFKCCGCTFSSLDKRKFLQHSDSHQMKKDSGEQLKRYECSVCYERFETLSEKRTHQRFPYRKRRAKESEEEITMTVLRCCGCPKVFKTIPELRSHQNELHFPQRVQSSNEELSIECGGCYKLFKNTALLNKHLRRAADKKLYACSKCTVARRSLKDLIEHEATHKGGGAFVCCGCRRGFETQDALEHHSLEEHSKRPKIYHNDESDTIRPFECKICYRKYKSARDLRGHQRFVYYDKIHTCDTCGKGFSQESSLSVHMARHKKEAKFPCPICGKKYKHEIIVRNCITRHERPKEHKCKICNVIFPAASNLYSHMVSHSADRRYKCDVCGQMFKRSFHLRKHKITHTSEKNYPCEQCSARFCSTTELYKHQIRHTGIYPYECSICSKKVTTRQVYIKHYESHIDEKDKIFTCDVCPTQFSQEHFLSNHIKYTHRIEPQDKHWNDKFNRQGPSRMKGGPRMAGLKLSDSIDTSRCEAKIAETDNGDPLLLLERVDEEVVLTNE